MSYFVAVDGEGYTVEETGEHRYNMMCASTGAHAYDTKGLRTVDCFRFLLDAKEAAGPDSVFVGFAINYDVNMMLRDIGKTSLVELWLTNECRWRQYKIRWLPGKFFQISDKRKRRGVRVYDTFGFFQCSFAKALAGWRVPAPEQLDHMKASRSQFTDSMMRRVMEYCMAECHALVNLLDQLKASLSSVNLPVASWLGAGAIAAALLRREGVGDHIQPDSTYGDLVPGIMSAYFGGRTELFRQGEFTSLHGYDIRSAYPYACLTLPSLQGASFLHDPGTVRPSDGMALHRVMWRTDPRAVVQPFPFRSRRRITYPSVGEGYYWSCEVAAAMQRHGSDIKILDTWHLRTVTEGQPLAFVEAIYKERAKLKEAGHFGHQSYKLAINALYGKLAQGIGYNGRDPRYRSYVWAGWITAATRAYMMRLATDDVAMIATDGIYLTRDPGYETGGQLGDLEASVLTDAFIAQPGIYTGKTETGDLVRSRGVFAKEVNFDDLRQGYEKHGPYYVSRMESTRFVGVGTCITRRSFGEWRRWVTNERKITLYPSRKLVLDDSYRPVIHTAPAGLAGVPSDPYDPKRGGMDAPGMVDFLQALEQPMREEIM